MTFITIMCGLVCLMLAVMASGIDAKGKMVYTITATTCGVGLILIGIYHAFAP